jgi:hypothetical protein
VHKSVWRIAPGVVLLCSALGACSSSGNDAQHKGVQVIVVNSNKSDVMIYGCPPCKPARLVGCRNPACPEPTPGQDLSGSVFGWTETRRLPRRYRMVLLRGGKPLNCPPATGRPASIASSTPYAVVYDITPSGRCVIASHAPLN